MSSDTQLLIHEGELNQIIEMIENSRQASGHLFGLWRNSLRQPVIQLVTGPEGDMEKTLRDEHALLKLGSWFKGEASDHSSSEFANFGEKGLNILLFINLTRNSLSGQFIVRLTGEEETNGGQLCREDILPGQSSFRICSSLVKKITRQKKSIDDRIKNLPPKIAKEIEVAQWYTNDDGNRLLESINKTLAKSYSLSIARNSETHDLQMTLDDKYVIHFTSNFPKKAALFGRSNSATSSFVPLEEFSQYGGPQEIARQLAKQVQKKIDEPSTFI